MRRSTWLRGARLALSIVVLGFIAWALRAQWTAYRAHPLETQVSVAWLLAAAAVYLATYAVLIQTWRLMLRAWDAHLGFWRSAHIWTVSSLYRYVPGTLWQVGAMGVMAEREGVSGFAAGGTAILSTIVNLAAGVTIALATAWRAMDRLAPGGRPVALALAVAAAAGLALLPVAMPAVMRLASRLTGRELPSVQVPPRVIGYAVVGNLIAWGMYGLAFQCLTHGILGQSAGALPDYIAVYTASYVLGYVVLFLPAGLGAADASMAAALPALGLMSAPQAALVAVASRLLRTVLEVIPGFLFAAVDAVRRRGSSHPESNASSR